MERIEYAPATEKPIFIESERNFNKRIYKQNIWYIFTIFIILLFSPWILFFVSVPHETFFSSSFIISMFPFILIEIFGISIFLRNIYWTMRFNKFAIYKNGFCPPDIPKWVNINEVENRNYFISYNDVINIKEKSTYESDPHFRTTIIKFNNGKKIKLNNVWEGHNIYPDLIKTYHSYNK